MTKITLSCRSPDDTVAVITIDAGLLASTWLPDDPAVWGDPGGVVSNWAVGAALLQGPGGPDALVLHGMTRATEVDAAGAGEKNYDDGTFPEGAFTWTCVARD